MNGLHDGAAAETEEGLAGFVTVGAVFLYGHVRNVLIGGAYSNKRRVACDRED